jgi:hypothetical protein
MLIAASCTVSGGQVLTFDNACPFKLNATSWTLMAGHCVELPEFALLIKQLDDTEALVSDYHINLESSVSHVSIFGVAGNSLPSARSGC